MPLKLIREDITKLKCDAIVNAANITLLGGGGVDGAIHRAAGKQLLEECRTLGGCETGQARITKGYDLPAKYVIHTVGPVWNGGGHGEEALLRCCYRNSLAIAAGRGLESVAFPLISSGAYGYPKDQALKVAVDEITSFLLDNEMLVYLVIFDRSSYSIGGKLFDNIAAYIDDKYVDEHVMRNEAGRSYSRIFAAKVRNREERPLPDEFDGAVEGSIREAAGEYGLPGASFEETLPSASEPARPSASEPLPMAGAAIKNAERAPGKAGSFFNRKKASLDDALRQLDESFSEMLLRKIDEKHMTDAECYKKANIDRKHFSKIRSDRLYRPSKATALAFAIAHELSLDETGDLLRKAGYALSHSNKFDIIVEYFIMNGNYNVFEINEALFAFDQTLLGV